MTYKKTDWRVIGVSGETADGRTIFAKELQEMADQYDPEIYGARINLEHMNFLFPDFAGGYGDVVELKAEPWAKDETKTALLAKLNITESLQKLWDSGQKIYTSMEITPRFADTKKAYLTGLAITDTPASLGTTANYTAAKTKAEEKIFTAYRKTETQEIAMTKPQDNNQDSNQAATTVKPLTEEHAESIFSRLFAKYFGKKEPEQTESPAINPEQPSEPKEGQQFKQEGWDGFSKSVQLLEKLDEKIEAQQTEYNALRAEFDKFKAEIEASPYTGQRQEHSGSQSAARVAW
jgi:phage capsid scaffolding protein (GPO) serine peptidase|nr:MAG TPA: capsid scaffolding protein [Caudoviricetes sp.]